MIFKTFEDFLFENSNGSDLHKIYAIVDTHTGHDWGKYEGSEFFKIINKDNLGKEEIDPELPVMNYNIDYTTEFIKDNKNFVYNPVDKIQMSNSKKKFHEIVEGDENIPKTAYDSKKAIKEIGFPMIAKPKNGHSGQGIEIFKNEKEFNNADHSKFDLYSEFIDKKSEHRLISFKGEPYVWFEREAVNDKAKGGSGDSDGKMKFNYEKKDPANLPKNFLELNKRFTEKFKDLPYICFDIMEDQNGKAYIIESNSMAGQPFDCAALLYRKLFKDFYGRDLDESSSKKLDQLSEKMINRTLKKEPGRWTIEK